MSDKHELLELDAWIAERLFGYVWVRFTPPDPWAGKRALETPRLLETSRHATRASGDEPLAPDWYDWKSFSTDPAAAIQVLERLAKERVLHVVIYFTGNWRVQCGIPKEPFIVDEGADSLPEAICRFAKAVYERMKEPT